MFRRERDRQTGQTARERDRVERDKERETDTDRQPARQTDRHETS